MTLIFAKETSQPDALFYWMKKHHRVLLIIRGTTKEAAKKAIEMFPSAEFFSRDRASAYASAATTSKNPSVPRSRRINLL